MSLFKKFFGGQSKEPQKKTTEKTNENFPGNTILEFHQLIDKSIEWNELKNEEFAMWLPSAQDRLFTTSVISQKWTTIYTLTKNYWSYITADLLKILKLVDDDTFRIDLPDTFNAFAFLTTSGEQIVLSLSTEKGIRFHFSETISLDYRILFMDKFIAYCKAWELIIRANNGEKDNDIGFEEWWLLTSKTSKTVEDKEPLKGVGKIVK